MKYIFLGVICEIYWAYGLKHFVGSFWGLGSVIVAVVASFVLLIMACKKLEVSVAYAVFVGLGSAGLVGIDLFLVGLDWKKLFLLCVLLVGIVGLKYSEGKAQ